MPDLQQRVVAFLEGRRTAELTDLIRRHNGVPLAAPCLREVHSPGAASLQHEVARVCEAVLAAVQPLELNGKTVAVQLYGEPNPALSQALRARGAEIIELAPYVWDRPVDPAPILRLLDALEVGSVDALLITSQAQVDNLFGVARDHGRAPRLDHVAIGAQGPVAEAALARHGLEASFRPAHGHMGALVLAAADYFRDLPLPEGEAARSAGEGAVVAADVRAIDAPSPRPSPKGRGGNL